jgi:hypothetical protein
MKVQAFIFNWPGQKQRAKELEDLLNPHCETFVINSDEAVRNLYPHWHHLPNDAFFAAQWNRAMELFNGDILVHVQADAWPYDVAKILDQCVHYIRDRKVGVYAPNLDFTDLEYRRNALVAFDDDVYEVPSTDETCWTLSAEVVRQMPLANPTVNQFGWGMDFVASAVAQSMRRKVVRDYRFKVFHPKGRGYNEPQAREKWMEYKLGLDPQLRKTVEHLETEVLRLMPGRLERLKRRMQRAIKAWRSAGSSSTESGILR